MFASSEKSKIDTQSLDTMTHQTHGDTGQEFIVLIDDDRMYARGFCAHLTRWFGQGNTAESMPEIRSFTSTSEAIAFTHANHARISVIVTDYRMPDMDGLELIKEIEGAERDYQIILLSGQIDLRLTESALHLNIFDFLEKSMETDTVMRTVGQARSYWKSRREKTQRIEETLKEKLHEQQGDQLQSVQIIEVRKLNGQLKNAEFPEKGTANDLAENAACPAIESYESYNGIVGRGPAFQKLKETIARVAQSNATCLIQGPSGSGKELVARAIHNESLRPDGPYVVVNCGAIPAELIESELFGHVRGSFTGALHDRVGLVEAARGGTLFLDEVTEMPLHLQVKLLRFLQEGMIQRVGETELRSVDVRIVAATNRNPTQAIAENRFREDLYYRLNVVPIQMPALRERPEDIPALAGHFLSVFAEVEHKEIKGIDSAVLQNFGQYCWPGNIRELRNLIHRMVLFAEGDHLSYSDLPRELIHYARGEAEASTEQAQAAQPAAGAPAAAPARASGAERSLRDMERESIQQALIETGYNKEAAARRLGISRASIYRKIRQYQIQTRHKMSSADGAL